WGTTLLIPKSYNSCNSVILPILVLLPAVIRRLPRDHDIMGVTFNDACGSVLSNLAFLQFCDGFRPAVSHSSTEAARQLVQNFRNQPLERHPAGDPFRNKLLDIVFHVLKVPVTGPFFHRLN